MRAARRRAPIPCGPTDWPMPPSPKAEHVRTAVSTLRGVQRLRRRPSAPAAVTQRLRAACRRHADRAVLARGHVFGEASDNRGPRRRPCHRFVTPSVAKTCWWDVAVFDQRPGAPRTQSSASTARKSRSTTECRARGCETPSPDASTTPAASWPITIGFARAVRTTREVGWADACRATHRTRLNRARVFDLRPLSSDDNRGWSQQSSSRACAASRLAIFSVQTLRSRAETRDCLVRRGRDTHRCTRSSSSITRRCSKS